MVAKLAMPDEGVVDVWRVEGALPRPGATHPDDAPRAARFRGAPQRTRFFARRAALRSLLGRYRGVPADRVTLLIDPGGLPYLAAGTADPLRFSVSDTGTLLLIAVARAAVGVDVERVDPSRIDNAVAVRFFTRAERRHLARVGDRDRAAAFLACWTMKEALAKATGLGLSLPLAGFDLAPRGPRSTTAMAIALGAEEETLWSIEPLDIAVGIAAAVAIEGSLDDVQVRALDPHQ